MLETIYDTYKLRLSDITFFEPVMEECVNLLNSLCQKHNNIDVPHHQVIGFVDGHLQVMCTSQHSTSPASMLTRTLQHKLPTNYKSATTNHHFRRAIGQEGEVVCVKTLTTGTSSAARPDGTASRLHRHRPDGTESSDTRTQRKKKQAWFEVSSRLPTLRPVRLARSPAGTRTRRYYSENVLAGTRPRHNDRAPETSRPTLGTILCLW